MWIFDLIILVFVVITAFISLQVKDLLSAAMIFGVYSFLMCLLWSGMGAVDVAFTEAAVGAGMSTVLFLGALGLTTKEEKKASAPSWGALLLVVLTGAALVYGTMDLPHYGDPAAPIHHHTAPRFIEESPKEIGVPNMVTSVLASYRGYDTLGETTVIFTAGLGVILILRRRNKEEDV